jgi:hypothetical protein
MAIEADRVTQFGEKVGFHGTAKFRLEQLATAHNKRRKFEPSKYFCYSRALLNPSEGALFR